jgi:hypothetical protein
MGAQAPYDPMKEPLLFTFWLFSERACGGSYTFGTDKLLTPAALAHWFAVREYLRRW